MTKLICNGSRRDLKPVDFWQIGKNELSEQQTKKIEYQWLKVAKEYGFVYKLYLLNEALI
jgi:hypothetical protein